MYLLKPSQKTMAEKAWENFEEKKMEEALVYVEIFFGSDTDTETWSWFQLPIPKLGFGSTLPQVGIFFVLNFLPWEFLLIKMLKIEKN